MKPLAEQKNLFKSLFPVIFSYILTQSRGGRNVPDKHTVHSTKSSDGRTMQLGVLHLSTLLGNFLGVLSTPPGGRQNSSVEICQNIDSVVLALTCKMPGIHHSCPYKRKGWTYWKSVTFIRPLREMRSQSKLSPWNLESQVNTENYRSAHLEQQLLDPQSGRNI